MKKQLSVRHMRLRPNEAKAYRAAAARGAAIARLWQAVEGERQAPIRVLEELSRRP